MIQVVTYIASQLAMALVNTAVEKRKKNKMLAENNKRLPGVDDLQFPVVTESEPLPVLFGTHWLKSPNVLWYGFFRRRQRADGDVEAGVVRFDGVALLSYCSGPIDKVLRITGAGVLVDDTEYDLTSGPVSFTLDAGQIWGHPREGGEGGLNGKWTLQPGLPDQSIPDLFSLALTDRSGNPINDFLDVNGDPVMPAFRGMFTVLLGDYLPPGQQPSTQPDVTDGQLTVTFGQDSIDRFYFGARPVLKPIEIMAQRMTLRGFGITQWYPETVDIGVTEMNPAHIIHELLTDETLGYAVPTSAMDDTINEPVSTFQTAANRLVEDDLGLSFVWGQQSTRLETIAEVLRHINGVLYRNPRTGKYELKLFRDDYDANLLPVLGPSNIEFVNRYSRPDLSTLPTVLDCRYMDRESGHERVVRQDDQAGLLTRGDIREEVYFQMAATGLVASRIATQYMLEISAPLAVVELSIPYSADLDFLPGDVFVWQWPDYGIEAMVLRVVSVSRGMVEDGNARLRCIEDKYAWRDTVYASPPQSAWVDPVVPALDPQAAQFELPFLLWLAGIRQSNPWANVQDIANDARGIAGLCVFRPNDFHTGFELWSEGVSTLPRLADNGADWAYTVFIDGTLSPTSFGVGGAAATTTLSLKNQGAIPDVGALILIGAGAGKQTQEFLLVTASYEDAGVRKIDVERALFDTDEIYDNVFFPVGITDPVGIILAQVIDVDAPFDVIRGYAMDVPRDTSPPANFSNMRALTTTGRGQLAFASATQRQVILEGRQNLPIAPYIALILDSDTSTLIGWRNRNRLVDRLVFTSQNVEAEAGVTYELRIFEVAPTPQLLRTVSLASSVNGYNYLNADESADRGGGLADTLRVELAAFRDGKESYFLRSKLFYRT